MPKRIDDDDDVNDNIDEKEIKNTVVHHVGTAEALSLGTVFKCGDPDCLDSHSFGKDHDIQFKTQKELDDHIFKNHKKKLASGYTICKYCKRPYEFGRKFIKVKKKGVAKIEDGYDIVFNHNRPTAKAVEMGVALHPECRADYKEALGDVGV